jgi:hypothetical protein
MTLKCAQSPIRLAISFVDGILGNEGLVRPTPSVRWNIFRRALRVPAKNVIDHGFKALDNAERAL